MRQVARFDNETQAQRICDYLLVNGIATQVMPDDGQFVLWVIDEDEMDVVQREVAEFRGAPNSSRYDGHSREADAIRDRLHKEDQQAKKNYIDVRKRWTGGRRGGGYFGFRPQDVPGTVVVLGISVVVFLATFGGSKTGVLGEWMFFARPVVHEGMRVGHTGWQSIMNGEVWRLVTPIFLHFGILHILFNGLMMYQLGGAIEIRKGLREFIILLIGSAIVSNVAQFVISGSPFFGGLSGVLYAQFGYIWMRARFEPGSGLFMSNRTIIILLVWLVVCFTGFLGPIANWAHVGGLVAGLAYGYIPTLFKRT